MPDLPVAAPDPASVSPADTIRLVLNLALACDRMQPAWESAEQALAALDEWVAAGERDRAEIARLADRAVCSGCGGDIYDDGGCSYPTCEWGELIPSSELPLALQASCDKLAEVRAERDEEIAELIAARERDRQQIARLTEALAVYADPRNWSISRDGLRHRVVAWIGPGATKSGMPDAMETARAVLAGEEDANPRLPQESLGHPMTTDEDDPLEDDPPDEGILNAWAGEEDHPAAGEGDT